MELNVRHFYHYSTNFLSILPSTNYSSVVACILKFSPPQMDEGGKPKSLQISTISACRCMRPSQKCTWEKMKTEHALAKLKWQRPKVHSVVGVLLHSFQVHSSVEGISIRRRHVARRNDGAIDKTFHRVSFRAPSLPLNLFAKYCGGGNLSSSLGS